MIPFAGMRVLSYTRQHYLAYNVSGEKKRMSDPYFPYCVRLSLTLHPLFCKLCREPWCCTHILFIVCLSTLVKRLFLHALQERIVNIYFFSVRMKLASILFPLYAGLMYANISGEFLFFTWSAISWVCLFLFQKYFHLFIAQSAVISTFSLGFLLCRKNAWSSGREERRAFIEMAVVWEPSLIVPLVPGIFLFFIFSNLWPYLGTLVFQWWMNDLFKHSSQPECYFPPLQTPLCVHDDKPGWCQSSVSRFIYTHGKARHMSIHWGMCTCQKIHHFISLQYVLPHVSSLLIFQIMMAPSCILSMSTLRFALILSFILPRRVYQSGLTAAIDQKLKIPKTLSRYSFLLPIS